jgi:hypothetical protein
MGRLYGASVVSDAAPAIGFHPLLLREVRLAPVASSGRGGVPHARRSSAEIHHAVGRSGRASRKRRRVLHGGHCLLLVLPAAAGHAASRARACDRQLRRPGTAARRKARAFETQSHAGDPLQGTVVVFADDTRVLIGATRGAVSVSSRDNSSVLPTAELLRSEGSAGQYRLVMEGMEITLRFTYLYDGYIVLSNRGLLKFVSGDRRRRRCQDFAPAARTPRTRCA